MNGKTFAKLEVNEAPFDTVLTLVPSGNQTITASISSYKDGVTVSSATRSVSAFAIVEAVPSLQLDFDSGEFTNFFADQFSITRPVGFQNNAIHSTHPYPNASSLQLTFTQPFTLSTGTIQFDEIVLVEPGTSNDWTDPNFFDFCVVEGSVDGITWHALAAGYDSRDESAWLNTYNSGGPGTSALYRPRTITVPPNLFAEGENIFLRFRLQSDPLVTGWGWAIDNLQIQTDITSVADEAQTPERFSLAQNYPNPFNPSTTIRYELPRASEITLVVYNMMGQRVRTLVKRAHNAAGVYSIEWNGKDENGKDVASGAYVYRIQTGTFTESRKMLFLK